MNNTEWSEEELADIDLPWEQFHELHPDRSHTARRLKRSDLKKGRTPTPKKQPKYEEPEAEISDEELFNATIAYQKAVNAASPHSLHHHISIDTDEPIIICFPSDWHVGSQGTDLEGIRADIQLMASHPNVYCALGGDPVDNFILEGMESAARSQITQVNVQWRHFRYLLKMLYDSGSLLWVSSGNHDAWTLKVSGIDPILASLAGIPVCYTEEGGFVHLTVGQQKYVIYRKHRPSRSSADNVLNFLKQMLMKNATIEFDIGVSEHLHKPDLEIFEYRPGSKIDRVLIACGSYKLKDPYAESLGLYGSSYGVPSVILYPDRRELIPFKSISLAIEALDGVSLSYAA